MADPTSSSSSSPPADHPELLIEHDDEPELDIDACLQYAEELKAQGNDHFRAREWDEALVAYRTGLGRLPKRKSKPSPPPPDEDEISDAGDAVENPKQSAAPEVSEGTETEDVPISESERACAKARAVLNANIGACYVKLDDHKQAVDACSQALLDDPNYVKALQRRSASNDKIGSWSSLASAQEDYNTLLKLLPPSSRESRETAQALHSLKPRLEAAQKTETAEMMNKFKSLGNSILGNFGLSTDNFKFEPNGQGGYGMSFQR